MARLALIIFSLVLLFGSSIAFVSEAMIASMILLNTILGSTYVDLAVASAIGEASLRAVQGHISPDPMPYYFPTVSGEATERRRRRRREEPKTEDSNDDIGPTENRNGDLKASEKRRFLTNPDIDGDMRITEKSLADLQDEIFQNFGTIAHDVASELSMHLGLRPHTLEAVLVHEEDAPSFPEVLESVAKRFHAPKLMLAGLHALIERTNNFEDLYDDENNDNDLS